ncbi:molybdopterin-synthase adenylyltransferase MoeB [Alphaproteobacteria bacterium GH1-50]|uniref:Molybdopterin-synthase adenylyltransferase n=1 Tax=Kangsaoukella pontilimi TaxID=2691042 RepID=A0A7C9N1B9_9RHOB|nr:molybdopterin-synthase adenylyltransferase MoeB [Kangsaoukella pontilimi]MXQ08638.1 molybdopterin-synthase adenylyltransferase MoeB [Kangsaoukella pontilimi]
MALVLALAVFLWFIGSRMNMPVSARLLMIGLLYVAVMAVHVALPEGHALREATGGSAGEWAVLGLLGAVVWVYSKGLAQLRKRVLPENRAKAAPSTSSAELERNARHIVLREIGGPGQKRLKEARVLVVGAGGLGAPALQYLCAAGVGTIGVIDDDVVENSNLQRQVIHTDERIGMPKVFSAEIALTAQNPFVTVRPYHRRLTADIVDDLFTDYDLILDGTDDVETRYLVNEAAVRAELPLVSAAISQWEGQISIFDPSRGAPCYACVFPEAAAPGLAPSCAEGGVLGPLPGVVGAMMAVEAIKLLANAGEPLLGRMMIYDALYADTRTITVKPRPDCPVCGKSG